MKKAVIGDKRQTLEVYETLHADANDDHQYGDVSRSKKQVVDLSQGTKRQLSIDPTFDHGPYEGTPFTYRSPFFERKCKNITEQWVPAVMLGPTMLHDDKSEATFRHGLRSIAETCNLQQEKVNIITDGEPALINACDVFKHRRMHRCTIHYRKNCADALKNIGIKGPTQDAFLDTIFGDVGMSQ